MATVNPRFNINLENAEENYSDHGSGSSSSFDGEDPCFEITKSCSKLSIQNSNVINSVDKFGVVLGPSRRKSLNGKKYPPEILKFSVGSPAKSRFLILFMHAGFQECPGMHPQAGFIHVSAISSIHFILWRPLGSDEDSESSDDDDAVEEPAVEIPSLDEKDEKSYLEVVRLIEGGKIDKLKVDQCKLYLKKYGLRRTGKKAVLIQRIQEHLEIKDGSGERKYPSSSFVLNCKGDACNGDIVMFEQNVYEKYSIASRSATGPSIGTRLVVGRIVKESYGAAKQQHTFTIEVLWSKGENPLPPLHPLLIKGRNLYRLKTVRQPWSNEEDRNKVIQEKHSRGSVARQVRDMRIPKKEIRRSHQVRSIQKENVSASNDRSSFERKPFANAHSKSLPLHIDAMDPNTLASAGNLRHLNSRDHQAYMGMKMLEGGNKIQSSSYTGYNFHVHSNNGYLNNTPSAASTSGYIASSSGIMRQTRPTMGLSDIRLPSRNGPLGSRAAPGDHNGKREPCKHFLRGNCWYGERCRYVHDTSMLRYNQTHYR